MNSPDVHFVRVGKGRLALYHRPRNADLPLLRKMGCTHIVTLLKESEGAQKIGSAAQNAGLVWIWLPVPNGDFPTGEVHQRLVDALPQLSNLLDEGASLLIHCSAGIHRTGTVAYGLLRWRGESREKALDLISQMRDDTHNEMGEKRLRWGDSITSRATRQKQSWIKILQDCVSGYWNKVFKTKTI